RAVGDRVELIVKLELRDQVLVVADGALLAKIPVLYEHERRAGKLLLQRRDGSDSGLRELADTDRRGLLRRFLRALRRRLLWLRRGARRRGSGPRASCQRQQERTE